MNRLYLLLILFLGTILRFYNNLSVSLWHDEAFSTLYIRYPWGEMMHRIGLDVHPPLYYILLRLWSYVFGQSILSLRAVSVLFGVLTIWAGYKLVKQAFSAKGGSASGGKNPERFALFSALLLAINPFQIQYALEIRMYTMGTFLILWSSYLLVKALEENKRKDWILYSIATAACLYTHYYLVFSIFAQGLYLLYHLYKTKQLNFANFRDNRLINATASFILGSILFMPWLSIFNEQRSRVVESFWIPGMHIWSIPETIWKMIFGGEGMNRPTEYLAAAVTLYLIYFFATRFKNREKWLVILGLVVPFISAVALSLKTAIYLDRYFVFASLFMTILVAGSIIEIKRPQVRKTLAVVLVACILFAFFKNWEILGSSRPGMRGAYEFIKERVSANDQIYAGSSFVFFTFKYYNETGIKPLLYSPGDLDTIPHFSGTAILMKDDLIMDFKQAPKNSTVWLLWTTGFNYSTKPITPGNWQVVQEKAFKDTLGFKGSVVITQYHVN